MGRSRTIYVGPALFATKKEILEEGVERRCPAVAHRTRNAPIANFCVECGEPITEHPYSRTRLGPSGAEVIDKLIEMKVGEVVCDIAPHMYLKSVEGMCVFISNILHEIDPPPREFSYDGDFLLTPSELNPPKEIDWFLKNERLKPAFEVVSSMFKQHEVRWIVTSYSF